MDVVAMAKRVVALKRQIKGWRAMVRTGDLTQAECEALCLGADAEIARMRSQEALPLEKVKGVK